MSNSPNQLIESVMGSIIKSYLAEEARVASSSCQSLTLIEEYKKLGESLILYQKMGYSDGSKLIEVQAIQNKLSIIQDQNNKKKIKALQKMTSDIANRNIEFERTDKGIVSKRSPGNSSSLDQK